MFDTSVHMPIHTTASLCQDLRHVGLADGDVLIVHSSMKSIGSIDGGPITVVAAILQAVGERGTVLMPVFTDPQPDGVFYLARTPSRTGVITETFRTTTGAVRSHHPTHSVAAIGAQAESLTAGHDKTSGLGVDSPLHKAAKTHAKILMIGCDLKSASIIHVAEAIARVPYLGKVWYDGYDRTLTMVFPNGSRVTVPPRDPPTCSAAFDTVQDEMESRGLIRHVRVGDAPGLLYTASDAIDVALDLLRADWKALLCHHPRCPVCIKARSL